MPKDTTPTFTQEQVNGMLARERKRLEQQLGDYETVKRELTAANEGLQQQLEQVTQHVTTLTERTAEREQAHAAELGQARAQRAQALDTLRHTRLQVAVTQGLVAAGVHAPATHVAAAELVRTVTTEQGPDGEPIAYTLGGARFGSATEAAREFLKAQPWFAAASGGGGGTRPPVSGGGGGSDGSRRDITRANPADLANDGWKDVPR